MITFLENKISKRSNISTVSYINKIYCRFLSESLIKNPFYAPIPYRYLRTKEDTLGVIFGGEDLHDLDVTLFCDRVKEVVGMNSKYNVYIRIRRKEDYRMANKVSRSDQKKTPAMKYKGDWS